MAHEISAIDCQEGTFQAWHGLTKVKPDLSLDTSWLSSWDVIPKRMALLDENNNFQLDNNGNKIIVSSKQMVASDMPTIEIGKPYRESYGVISNKMFLDTIRESLVGVDGVKLVSIGSVCERNRVFASFEIDSAKHSVGGREFKQYWTILNSFDGSSVFADVFSNVCTVCNNTFRMNLSDKSGDRIKHTKNATKKLLNIPEKINQALGAASEFNKVFAAMAEQPCKVDTAERIFAGYLGDGEVLSTRSSNDVARMVSLYQTGAGNRGETLADVFSAITDFYSHESSKGTDRMKQWLSSEFGDAAKKKEEFLPLVSNAGNRMQLITKGKRSLELTASAN